MDQDVKKNEEGGLGELLWPHLASFLLLEGASSRKRCCCRPRLRYADSPRVADN